VAAIWIAVDECIDLTCITVKKKKRYRWKSSKLFFRKWKADVDDQKFVIVNRRSRSIHALKKVAALAVQSGNRKPSQAQKRI
jgi:hypothetical protein